MNSLKTDALRSFGFTSSIKISYLKRENTVNLRTSARGTYFKFRRRPGRLMEGRLFDGDTTWSFSFNVSSTRKQQHKLFVDILKSNLAAPLLLFNVFTYCVHKLKQCTNRKLHILCWLSTRSQNVGKGEELIREGRGGAYFKFWPIGGALIRTYSKVRYFEDLRCVFIVALLQRLFKSATPAVKCF